VNQTLKEVKKRIGLLSLLEDHYGLEVEDKGSRHVMLCPIHEGDSVPSFNIYVNNKEDHSEDSWYCFGCGRGGDVVNFVMEHEDKGFREALKTLQRIGGIGDVKEQSKIKQWWDKLTSSCKVKEKDKEKVLESLKYDLGIRLREYLKRFKEDKSYQRRCEKVDKIFKQVDELFVLESFEEAEQFYVKSLNQLRRKAK